MIIATAVMTHAINYYGSVYVLICSMVDDRCWPSPLTYSVQGFGILGSVLTWGHH